MNNNVQQDTHELPAYPDRVGVTKLISAIY